MQVERRFGQTILVSVTLGFVALLVAVGAVAWGFERSQAVNRLIRHTFQVELALSEVRALTERVETARRGFLLQPDERFFATFVDAEERFKPLLVTLADLMADNPSQQPRIERLRQGIELQRQTIETSIETRRGSGLDEARRAFLEDGGVDAIRDLRVVTGDMVTEEQQLLAKRSADETASLRHAYIILGLAVITLVVVAAGTIQILRRNLRDLSVSRRDLREMNENLEAAVATRTADLQRANDEIQRFAYIVSHDLRSPLVNVMGFTSEMDAARKSLHEMVDRVDETAPELVSEEARLAVREDLPEAIGFIRSSTQKMDRLINAILRLSREGRRVITAERVRVGEIVEGIAASLAHRTAEVGAEIGVEGQLPEIVSDRLALEQIFSNLIENAVKYRDPKRPVRIAIRGRRDGGRAIFDVADNGRGIDPRDHDRVFDLFRRSGAQDQPGEGIGLAHVRALAYRLEGNISCASELGRGSTFTLSLPVAYQPRKEA